MFDKLYLYKYLYDDTMYYILDTVLSIYKLPFPKKLLTATKKNQYSKS